MTESEITALAREYAEFTDLSPIDKKNISAICENFLKYTLRRYCLAEKEAVRKEYKQAAEDYDPYDPMYSNRGKLDLFDSLFPDLGKEVEG